MAESFSVKAILSAADRGFTSTMRGALSACDTLGSKIKSGIGFGVLMATGQQAFTSITDGIGSMVSELNQSQKAWKTFDSNMSMLGKSSDEIKGVKKELQDYATQTIYNASDMASTYSQLAAVGTKNTTALVKGFGGLAAAAESPKQAMKTLSQQATQMAAKPTVAWEDFKLMLEQTPAGISAIAKEMGMSTQDMVKNVQDGKIATEDFFDAISRVGTNDAFTQLATTYKTADEAMAGLQETLAQKLSPAFEELQRTAVHAISGLISKVESADFSFLIDGFREIKDVAKEIGGAFKDTGAVQAFGDALSSIGDAASHLYDVVKDSGAFETFGTILGGIVKIASKVAGAIADFISNLDPGAIQSATDVITGLAIGFMMLKVASGVSQKISSLKEGLKGVSGELLDVSKSQEKVGKTSSRSSKKLLASAKAFAMIGAGVALISGSFYLLAQAAISLSDSGGAAIAIFAGMAAAVTALGLGMAYMLSNIKSTPKKMTAMGNSFLKMSAGIALVVASLSALALALVPIGQLGSTAVPALAAFGIVVAGLTIVFATFGKQLQTNMTGIIAFSASMSVLALAMAPVASTGREGAVAMAAFGVVVAGLVAVFALFGSSLTAAIPAMLVFGATILMVGAGMSLAANLINALTPFVEQLGNTFEQVGGVIVDVINSICDGFNTLCDGVSTVIDAISGGFSSVLDSVAGVIESIGTSAKNAGTGFKSVAQGITMISELSLGDIAKSLGAVALGLGEISSSGANLPEVASGMQLLVASLLVAAASLTAFNSGIQTMSGLASGTVSSVTAIKDAFANFTITPPNIGPMISAFTQIIAQSRMLIPGLTQSGQNAGQGLARGLTAGGRQAQASMKSTTQSVVTEGNSLTSKLTQAGQKAGNGFSKALRSGMNQSVSIVRSASNSIVSAMRSAQSGAYSSGVYIGVGLANGIRSQVGAVRSAAAALASAAEAAIVAKAKIGSPSKISTDLGEFWGIGWVNGILSKVKAAKAAAMDLISIPSLVPVPDIGMNIRSGGIQDLNDDYNYTRTARYTIIVPVEIDGKETARVTAPYTEAELDKKQKVKNMIKGIKG